MRNRMSSRNHPMQPLSPKHQPWFRMQAPDRSVASVNMSRTSTEPKIFGAASHTVEQELVLRARIEQRAAEKLEKLHDAVSHDRYVRRVQRNRGSDNAKVIIMKELSKVDAHNARLAQAA